MPTIIMSMWSVCLSVCLFAYLRNHTSVIYQIVCILSVAMAEFIHPWQAIILIRCHSTCGFLADDVMSACNDGPYGTSCVCMR